MSTPIVTPGMLDMARRIANIERQSAAACRAETSRIKARFARQLGLETDARGHDRQAALEEATARRYARGEDGGSPSMSTYEDLARRVEKRGPGAERAMTKEQMQRALTLQLEAAQVPLEELHAEQAVADELLPGLLRRHTRLP
jgi:hypothetical protein